MFPERINLPLPVQLNFFEIVPGREMRWRESGGGPPQSKTCRIFPRSIVVREASWSAPVPWRFGKEDDEK
jgi:hypothetical protein